MALPFVFGGGLLGTFLIKRAAFTLLLITSWLVLTTAFLTFAINKLTEFTAGTLPESSLWLFTLIPPETPQLISSYIAIFTASILYRLRVKAITMRL